MTLRWPWARHADTHDALAEDRRALAGAQARLMADEAAYAHLSRSARAARKKAGKAVAAEQAEIRRNHLGALIHDALIVPPRRKHP